jgi:hypothetical protein
MVTSAKRLPLKFENYADFFARSKHSLRTECVIRLPVPKTPHFQMANTENPPRGELYDFYATESSPAVFTLASNADN